MPPDMAAFVESVVRNFDSGKLAKEAVDAIFANPL